MAVYSEETIQVNLNKGLLTSKHRAITGKNTEGYLDIADNVIIDDDRLVTRKGFSAPSAFDTRTQYDWGGRRFAILPDNSFKIAAMYGAIDKTIFLKQAPNLLTFGAADATPNTVASTSFGTHLFKGAAYYLDRLYYNDTNNIYRLTGIDWTTGAVTNTLVAGLGGGADGLLAFKDRLWTWANGKVMYTNLPTGPGAYPETWDPLNFITISSEIGTPIIYTMLPIANRLLIFTSDGLFSLIVAGANPATWVLRTLKHEISVNHYNCAASVDGLIYFVDVNGVWVTNGSSVEKLSSDIEDLFEADIGSTQIAIYKLFAFLNGIMVVRATLNAVGTDVDPIAQATILYTSVEKSIAWSTIYLNSTSVWDVQVVFNKLRLKDDVSPRAYMVAAFGTDPNTVTEQLLKYTGYQDITRELAASNVTAAVQAYVSTRRFAPSPTLLKRVKYAYVDITNSASNGVGNFTFKYSTETIPFSYIANNTYNFDSAIDVSMVKVGADFTFRWVILELTLTLSATMTEVSIGSVYFKNHTNRNQPVGLS